MDSVGWRAWLCCSFYSNQKPPCVPFSIWSNQVLSLPHCIPKLHPHTHFISPRPPGSFDLLIIHSTQDPLFPPIVPVHHPSFIWFHLSPSLIDSKMCSPLSPYHFPTSVSTSTHPPHYQLHLPTSPSSPNSTITCFCPTPSPRLFILAVSPSLSTQSMLLILWVPPAIVLLQNPASAVPLYFLIIICHIFSSN